MELVISQLLKQFEDGKVTRRQLIQSLALAASAAAGAAPAAAQTTQLRAVNIEHLNYVATDYAKTRDFYAGLLGMTVANDNGKDLAEVHWGDARGVGVRDRLMMSLHTKQPAQSKTGIDHIAVKLADWDTDKVKAELERRGLKPRLAQGGAIDTPNYVSFMVQDPDGMGVQISGIAKPGTRFSSGPSAVWVRT
jgi:catechol 2,3-dioxygenase-like lactoylglutathione lyase family enzyme